jgi:hypothetical protein
VQRVAAGVADLERDHHGGAAGKLRASAKWPFFRCGERVSDGRRSAGRRRRDCADGGVCAASWDDHFGFDPGLSVCVPAHWTDGVRSGDETGPDEGGACGVSGACTSSVSFADADGDGFGDPAPKGAPAPRPRCSPSSAAACSAGPALQHPCLLFRLLLHSDLNQIFRHVLSFRRPSSGEDSKQ